MARREKRRQKKKRERQRGGAVKGNTGRKLPKI